MDDTKDRTLWCGNLSDKVTEDLLYELFIQAGPVENVTIPKDKEGRKKHFGFITFKHEVSVPYTVALMNGISLFGKQLRLELRTGAEIEDNPYLKALAVHQRSLSCPGNMFQHAHSKDQYSPIPQNNLSFIDNNGRNNDRQNSGDARFVNNREMRFPADIQKLRGNDRYASPASNRNAWEPANRGYIPSFPPYPPNLHSTPNAGDYRNGMPCFPNENVGLQMQLQQLQSQQMPNLAFQNRSQVGRVEYPAQGNNLNSFQNPWRGNKGYF